MTGTPIQNSLDDLQSLLKFLRVEPFNTAKNFREYVIKPLESDLDDGLASLRTLLRAVCLRRGSICLDLPSKVSETLEVSPNHEERATEARIVAECLSACNEIVSRQSAQRAATIVFGTIAKLRQLYSDALLTCNNGASNFATDAAVNETDCELCRDTTGDSKALLEGEAFCPDCSRPLGKSTASLTPSTPASSVSSPAPTTSNGGDFLTTSSKLDKVIENLEQHQADSKRYVSASLDKF